MTYEELSSLILMNRDSIAFLVGNGIHNYEHYNKHLSSKFTWKKLIRSLRAGLFPGKEECYISLTNQFDAIVHKKNIVDFEHKQKEYANSLSSLIETTEKSCVFKDSPYYDIVKLHRLGKTGNIIVFNEFLQKNETLQKVEEEIRLQVKRILSTHGLSFCQYSLDTQAIAYLILVKGNTDDFIVKQIIKTIFEDYKLQNWIIPFLRVAETIQAPILTTNYDTSLSKLAHLSPRIAIGASNKPQEGFPFETYFAPFPIIHPWDSFAIWHIHGLYNYVNSIRIGQNDYDNLQREIQARLSKTKNPLTDNNWESNNSWLSIVFRKNLFIMGLGLKKEEKVLWWLLEERAKYGLKGWYIYIECDKIDDEKINNLQNVGLDIIKVESQDLYENVWENLLKKLEVMGEGA